VANTAERDHQVSAFFAANADRLLRAVGQRVNAPHALIEDACSIAWTILLRRPDVDLANGGLSWLVTVAQSEAWRLSRDHHQEHPVGAFLSPERGDHPAGELPEPPDDARDVADQVIAHIELCQRKTAMQGLKPREREALYLRGLGYSYQEIMQITGATYTAVNRRITEGRATLRRQFADH
jgi:RNA polymerase sigma factor (sigma-70 family)